MALLENYTGFIGLPKRGQSPIDIDDEITRPKRFPPLSLHGHWLNEGDAILENDGKVASVRLSGDRIMSTVTGGPLFNDLYEFDVCNFRWGLEDCEGSEHTINGTWFSLEAQMVHWNRKYENFDACLKYKDGVCIISYFFLVKTGLLNNPQFDKITENLEHVVDSGSDVIIPANALCWMRQAIYCDYYYTYQGSYNEGECPSLYPECVTWIIFPLRILIAPSQANAFRMLKNAEGDVIGSNRRRTQLLRGYLQTDMENAKLIQQLGNVEGLLQSPINLSISTMTVIKLDPLLWFHYDVPPRKVKITNTGRTVVLSAKWNPDQERPYIRGGPFLGNYVFSQTHFHWGETEMLGSEHYVDGGCMPMELHAVHFKTEYKTQQDALAKPDGVTILVYLFKLQTAPNVLLNDIVKMLPSIKEAHSSLRIVPMVLTNIFAPFNNDYMVYWGSTITPHWTRKILWLVNRVPIGISKEQIAQFRTLLDETGAPILSNCRTLRDTQNRSVFHVNPSGSRYSTLLPISRKQILFSNKYKTPEDTIELV